ncbi:uncharacterized protein LOC132285228 [Cornus florida]|uniref:uncharacterized protein LOC132285228 n=1 Tax=Cornus florida TaxID=4283 RepID=UPI00289CB814|nr:uncharacterized protein LOC132285228 [Cornus florida]
MFLRRGTTLTSLVSPRVLSRLESFSSRAFSVLDKDKEATQSSLVNQKGTTSADYDDKIRLSPLFLHGGPNTEEGCNIELVDTETWRISSCLAEVWRETDRATKAKVLFKEADEVVDHAPRNNDDPDFDEIEDMRIRGNLFYKLDRDSKEFEEYNYDFHRRKSSKSRRDDQTENKKVNASRKLASKVEESSKKKDERNSSRKKDNLCQNLDSAGERLSKLVKNVNLNSPLCEIENSCIGKKVRTPSFNQLTAPYHEPFCLDIYISKGSVRACIIHRATSKVVAVAHSISKDMKFDLGSTKNAAACVAVGEVLAQRALADDIHNVVYTPRKGEKLEGKLQIVLQSIIDNDVNVKVKIKQRRVKKAGHWQSSTG